MGAVKNAFHDELELRRAIEDDLLDIPAWAQQPNETWREWNARRIAEREAKAAEAIKPRPWRPSTVRPTIAVGVGTYDGNGNPKGANWRD